MPIDDKIEKTVSDIEDTVKETSRPLREILGVAWEWLKVIVTKLLVVIAQVGLGIVFGLWLLVGKSWMVVRRRK